MSKPLDRWLLFLEDSPKEVLDIAMKAEPAIEKAQQVLEYLGTNEEIRRYYDLREKAIHDEITRITGARDEGMQLGIQQQRLEAAKKMIHDGLDDKLIEKYTGASLSEIENLKKNM